MLARLATAALVGLTAYPVGVEVDIGRGLPAVTVVGLGGTAVLEARDRLRAAFGNTGYEWPDRRITVSLPPTCPSTAPGSTSRMSSTAVLPCYDPDQASP
jgi:magnesium chelatase family protein